MERLRWPALALRRLEPESSDLRDLPGFQDGAGSWSTVERDTAVNKACTELFVHYREIARLVWNLGFCTKPDLLEWAPERAFDEAMARLFEGMILQPLGLDTRIELTFAPGDAAVFWVMASAIGVKLWVNKNPPGQPLQVWGDPVVSLGSDPYRLRFVAFFDWYQLAPRDFRLLEVVIEQLDGRPDLVGRHALIELRECSIWFDDDVSN